MNAELKTLKWDRNTGPVPKKGTVIENVLGDRYRVVDVIKDTITIELLPARGSGGS